MTQDNDVLKFDLKEIYHNKLYYTNKKEKIISQANTLKMTKIIKK